MSDSGLGWVAMGLAGTIIALAIPFLVWWIASGHWVAQ